MRLILFSVALTTHAICGEDASRLIRDSAARTPVEERSGFHVPEGFQIQLFADDAQLGGKPINMAFDARGRLWVTCTQEYPYAVKKEKWSADTTRATGSKDNIRILEDTDGDGRADKVTIFADDLNIPTGLQPYKSGCIAWSIPNILYLEDTQATQNSHHHPLGHNARPAASLVQARTPQKADKRSVIFGPLGYEKDTHGMISSMRLGLDGWIYATHGFSNTSHFQVLPRNRKPNQERGVKNQETLEITSGSVFRFKPDGSAVELWTSGQVNPFGLCWDSWGNLYSADCHSSPIYQLIRGATYPSFGKPADALGFAPVMCEHAHGSTGICGPIYIDGGVWGKEWDDHMLVCNPVTSKINHDHITFTGSSPKANEQPDFLTSDDDWFRPVDLQLGPDSALYIADFYNQIIGHYEVPLEDKRRDRNRGRIWRVARKGYTGKLAEWNITKLSDEDLVSKTKEHPNPLIRRLSYTELVQREYNLMPPRPDRPVGQHEHAGQDVTEAKISRHIVSTLMQPSHTGSIPNMLDWLRDAAMDDTHLRHALRIALRDSLKLQAGYEILSEVPDMAKFQTELIRISLAVPTADAASWLLEQIKSSAATKERDSRSSGPNNPGAEPVPILVTDRALLTQAITHIARHLPAGRVGDLVELVQKHFGDELDTQIDLFTAVREGQSSKDNTPVVPAAPASDCKSAVIPSLRAWAGQLARRLADWLTLRQLADWRPITPPTAANPSPWFRAMHPCTDGKERVMLESHPTGGKNLTGILRSKTFDLPPTLSFWLAGHRSFTVASAYEKNFVRLVDADTGHEIALAFPPRDRTARLITWQTGRMPAKHAYLELVDGDDGTGYTWLAAGGFDPEVVTIPGQNSPAHDIRIRKAAKLAASWKDYLHAPKLEPSALPRALNISGSEFPKLIELLRAIPHRESFSPDTRVALARLCINLPSVPSDVLELARDPELMRTVFQIMEDATGGHDEIQKAFNSLTSRAQIKLASALAGSKQTAATLLKSASPSVLADPLVTKKIKALSDATLSKQLTDITAKLPPGNDAVNTLIAARLKNYDPSKADAERGKLVFSQVCVACHRIGITGNLVGPQLDGIGTRGAERLLEDILDPNRAVDPAFRLHIVKVKNGELMTGLLRRDQGGEVVFADAAGLEHTVKKADVTSDQTSEFSLMPSGLGEVLTEQQVHDLLKFFLDRKNS